MAPVVGLRHRLHFRSLETILTASRALRRGPRAATSVVVVALLAFGAATAACAQRTIGHSPTPPTAADAATRVRPAAAPAAGPIAMVNPGFESDKTAPTGGPEGWYSYQHAGEPSYVFVLDADVRHSGLRSLRVDNIGSQPYGSTAQIVRGANFVGRKVRFSAWLRTRDTVDGASLFLIAEQGGNNLAYNFMAGSEVKGTHDWARHSITLDVPPGADQLRVGVTLQGPGSVWFDDAELEFVGAP